MRMKRIMVIGASALWIAATFAGVKALWDYEHRAGATGSAPRNWPSNQSLELLARDRPTLLVFFHSECPCSQATVSELARIAAQAPDRFSAQIYIYDPVRADQSAPEGSLWQATAIIPGARVFADHKGMMARTFGAETSGLALLYDPKGRLLFHGGITGGRGHPGDNPNKDALLACLLKPPAVPSMAPIYGCSIF